MTTKKKAVKKTVKKPGITTIVRTAFDRKTVEYHLPSMKKVTKKPKGACASATSNTKLVLSRKMVEQILPNIIDAALGEFPYKVKLTFVEENTDGGLIFEYVEKIT